MTRPFWRIDLLAALLAAACAQQARQEPPLPLLALDGRVCDSRPVFDGALAVPFDTRSGVAAALGARSRCLRMPRAPAPTTYAAFMLPQGVAPSNVTVSSLADGTLISPRATFYDAAGSAVRVLRPEDFRADIGGLQASVRLRGTERWVIVEASRATLGKPVPVPSIARETLAMHALNGTIRVAMAPVPTVP